MTVTASDTSSKPDPLVVLGRLLACPRGDSSAARDRLFLLRRLLRHGGGWWRAEDITRVDNEDLDALRAGLRELRKTGALVWDERAQAFALQEQLRVPLALMLLASDDTPQHSDQLAQLDALVPFAMASSRGDERQAPVWAMLDVLERDLRAMELAASDGPQALERCARERWLVRHAEDMRAAVARLEQLDSSESARQLIDRALNLLNRTGEQLARLSVRMSRTSRDQVRMAGSRRSAAELRAAAAALPAEQLAAAVHAQTGLAPAPVALPDEIAVADAHPFELSDPSRLSDAEREFPHAEQLELTVAVSDTAPAPDAGELATARLATAPPRRMAEHLFAPLETWEDAVRLQQGLVRVQSEAARLGRPGWQALPDPVRIGAPAPVSWLREIEREQQLAA